MSKLRRVLLLFGPHNFLVTAQNCKFVGSLNNLLQPMAIVFSLSLLYSFLDQLPILHRMKIQL